MVLSLLAAREPEHLNDDVLVVGLGTESGAVTPRGVFRGRVTNQPLIDGPDSPVPAGLGGPLMTISAGQPPPPPQPRRDPHRVMAE